MDNRTIRHLLNNELEESVITIVGLGSGGARVCDHLTSNGISRWNLIDKDVLDETNLVKHPRLRGELGLPKVDIQRKWILDRNPESRVTTYLEDVIQLGSTFEKIVSQSDLVLCCTDNIESRNFITQICVKQQIPYLVAGVFTAGFGGEVYLYDPGRTGCYTCLRQYLLAENHLLPDEEIIQELVERNVDGKAIYGRQQDTLSGLSLDISMIANIQARMALSYLLHRKDERHFLGLFHLDYNWRVVYTRKMETLPNIVPFHYYGATILQQQNCFCYSMGADHEMAKKRDTH